jgi:hypothetical protein
LASQCSARRDAAASQKIGGQLRLGCARSRQRQQYVFEHPIYSDAPLSEYQIAALA